MVVAVVVDAELVKLLTMRAARLAVSADGFPQQPEEIIGPEVVETDAEKGSDAQEVESDVEKDRHPHAPALVEIAELLKLLLHGIHLGCIVVAT